MQIGLLVGRQVGREAGRQTRGDEGRQTGMAGWLSGRQGDWIGMQHTDRHADSRLANRRGDR
jgi:hypothetical protein